MKRGSRYVLALLLPLGALLLRLALDPWLKDFQIWSFFYLAVMVSAWMLGWRPAVLTAVMALGLGLYFLLPPRLTWRVPHAYDWVGLATYSVVAAAIVLLVRAARWQQHRLHTTAEGLQREMEFSQATIDSLPGLFYMLDEQGRLRRWNKQMELLTGYAAAELNGKPGLELVPEEERAKLAAKIQQALAEGIAQVETHVLTREGRKVLHLFTGRRFAYNGQHGLVGMGVDLTARKAAETAHATLAAVVEHSTDAIVGEALDGSITSWNAGAERVFGYTAPEAIGRHISMVAPPGQAEDIEDILARIRHGEVVQRTEVERLRKDGQRITVSVAVSPIRDAEGQIVGIAKIAHDVTALKRAEEKLRQQEQLLRQVLELLPVGVWLMDKDGRIVDHNPAGAHIWGGSRHVSPEQFGEYRGWWASTGAPIAPEEWAAARAIAKGETSIKEEVYIQTFDGECRTILNSALPLRDERGAITGGIIVNQDITERKLAEIAQVSQNHRLALLNEAAARLLSINEPDRVLSELFARTAEYFQADVFIEYGLTPAGDRLELRQCQGLDPAVQRQIRSLELGEGVCGTVAQTGQAIARAWIQQSDEPMVQLIKGLGVRAYACNPLLVEGRLHGTLSFGSRLRDSFERADLALFQTLANYVALARERAGLLAELRRHTRNLEHTVAERTAKSRELLGELEHMSYSIMHEMRAPLRALQGYGEMVLGAEAERLSPPGQEYLRRLMAAAHRMDQLITDALSYNEAVRFDLPLGPVDPLPLLRTLLEIYPEFQAPGADIRLEGAFPKVLANEAGLTQCCSNLLKNAVKFVHPGRSARVRVWAEWRRPAPQTAVQQPTAGAQERPNAPSIAGPMVRLWFEDNGIGITEQNRTRIFDMFQRMHSGYEGTGIGLALVRKLMERMGGQVGVESEPAQGSRFWLELRAGEEPSPQ